MKSLQDTSWLVVRRMLAGQPTTAAKVTFAWQVAAGAPLARHAVPSWSEDGTLRLRPTAANWAAELRAHRNALAERMRELLGRDVVKKVVILKEL
jgi:predicted nucleic acid-binding Zn ribbon protein